MVARGADFMAEVKLRNEKPMTYEDMLLYREELKEQLFRLEAERNPNKELPSEYVSDFDAAGAIALHRKLGRPLTKKELKQFKCNKKSKKNRTSNEPRGMKSIEA